MGKVEVIRRGLWTLILPMALAWAVAQASGWESIWQRLESWEGPRHVAVRTNLEQPYANDAYRRLVNGLTERGFTVIPKTGGEADPDREGLIVELLETGTGLVVALSRASRAADHALLAVQPVIPAEPTGPATPARHIALQGEPKRVAALTSSGDRVLDLVLLHDDRLEWVSVEGQRVVTRARFASHVKGSRALYVDAGNVDADPREEIAVVWGQDWDVTGKGTRTRLSGRMLEVGDGGVSAEGPPLEAYLQTTNGQVLAQRRRDFKAYTGRVLQLTKDANGFALGSAAPVRDEGWLYELIALRDGVVAAWTGTDRLALHAPNASRGQEWIVDQLGKVLHPAVAVRLRERQVVTTPDPSSSVNEKYIPLPRRLIVQDDSTLYTIERGRSSRLSGVLESSGQDRVVRLILTPQGLRREQPFPAVERYILDFALVSRSRNSAVVLLTNEKPDGSGQASLVIQESRDRGG